MPKILVALPDAFKKEIDEIAKAEHRSRSDLFREALRRYKQEYVNRTFPLVQVEPKEFRRGEVVS